jgi:hypothetical protein
VTLRVRLTAALVVLVAVGLLVSDLATYTALRSYLITRIDQQLRSSPRPVLFAMSQPGLPGSGSGSDGGDQMLPEGTYAVIVDVSGAAVGDPVVFDYGGTALSPPDLPANIVWPDTPRTVPSNLSQQLGMSDAEADEFFLKAGIF